MLAAFRNDLGVAGFSKRTIDEYVRILGHAPFPLPGTVRQAKDWLAQRKREGLSANSLIVVTRALKAYSRWWSEEEDAKDPLTTLAFPKPTKAAPGRVAQDADIHKLLRALAGPKGIFGGERYNSRDVALIETFRYTGMRRGEVAAMRVEHVDLEAKRIVIPESKSGEGRVVPMSPQLVRALRHWMKRRGRHRLANTPYVWLGRDGPLRPDSITGLLRRLSDEHGISPPIASHTFRRAFAHKWAEMGGADDTLMAVAGWRNPTMPARYRAELRIERAFSDYERFFGQETSRIKAKPGPKANVSDSSDKNGARE